MYYRRFLASHLRTAPAPSLLASATSSTTSSEPLSTPTSKSASSTIGPLLVFDPLYCQTFIESCVVLSNFPSYPNHDLFEGLVFIDKHTQPSSDPCLNTLLHKYYGNIDPMVTLQYITAVFQTGNMHIAIYDFENSLMYVAPRVPSTFLVFLFIFMCFCDRFVSNALPPNATGYISNAYDNTFIRLNMTELWTVSQ